MHNSDDFFDDDDINDEAFALLDAAETQYFQSQQPKTQSVPKRGPSHHPLPPSKRPRTDNGWTSVTNATLGSSQGIPDILPRQAASGYRNVGPHLAGQQARGITESRTSHGKLNDSLNNVQGHVSRGGSISRRTHTQQLPVQQNPELLSQRSRSVRAVEFELEVLKDQLAELKKEKEEAERLAKEALDARYAKEGEAIILRKTIERTAQEHAKEVAKIKAAKEAAEAMQQQIQRNMQEDMERLNAQFTFKKHELESSLRNKGSWSVRSKKTGKAFQSSSPSGSHAPGKSLESAAQALRTPARPRYTSVDDTPVASLFPPGVAARNLKKAEKLPGFVNAFETSTPIRASQRAVMKGKARTEGILGRVSSKANLFLQDQIQAQFSDDAQPYSSPPSSPIQDRLAARAVKSARDDADLFDQGEAAIPSILPTDNYTQYREPTEVELPDDEEFERIELLDWMTEMQRIILGHFLDSSRIPTLQVLLNYTTFSREHSEAYVEACAKLLDIMGVVKLKDDKGIFVIQRAVESMTTMAEVLSATDSIGQLRALFGLMESLAHCIEGFSAALLSYRSGASEAVIDSPPRILQVVCTVIRKHLAAGQEPSEDFRVLALEIFGLIRSLSWCIPINLVPKLAYVIRSPNVLPTVLDPAHSNWFLIEVVRYLDLLVSHEALFRHLLSFPEGEEKDEAERDYGKIPHIEQLAFLLIDRSREGAEVLELREAILMLISTLGNAHSDAVAVLLQSQTLIPAIVVYLTNLTVPLWQLDDEFFKSPTSIAYACITGYRIVALLHLLIVESQDLDFDLYQKLVCASLQHYPCVDQLFIATMSRFSFCEIPQLKDSDRFHLENAADMADTLLSLVVTPETDLCMQAFKADEYDDEYDDEEREAQILHDNTEPD